MAKLTAIKFLLTFVCKLRKHSKEIESKIDYVLDWDLVKLDSKERT